MHIIIANAHRDFGGDWNLSCWVKDKRIMHDLCCNYIIWIHFHAHLAVGHKTHRRNPLNALSSVLQQQFHACKWIKCTVIEQGERSQSAGGYFLFISVNDQGITALWVITHLVEAVNQAFGPVLWTLEAVALRKTCVRQHTARVSAASVRVDTAGERERESYSWLPDCSAPCVCVGRARFQETPSQASAQLVHQRESSYNICWLHNMGVYKRGYEWEIFVRLRLPLVNVEGNERERRAEREGLNKTRRTLMDN